MAADVQPILSTKSYRTHGVLRQASTYLRFGIHQEVFYQPGKENLKRKAQGEDAVMVAAMKVRGRDLEAAAYRDANSSPQPESPQN